MGGSALSNRLQSGIAHFSDSRRKPCSVQAAVLGVPFVDVISTMSDSALPATVTEYEVTPIFEKFKPRECETSAAAYGAEACNSPQPALGRSACQDLPGMFSRLWLHAANDLFAHNYFQKPAKPWLQTVLRRWLAEA